MLRLLCTCLLFLQVVIADNVTSVPRQRNSNSAATPHVIPQLLLKSSPKFAPRDNGDGCPNGYQVCTNYPDTCAADGYYCCSDIITCPDNTNCFGVDECCPQDAQTCGGQTCCDAGSSCCSGNESCCDAGTFCCSDSIGNCCPNGMTCTPGEDTCSAGGGSGGSSSGGGSGDGGSGGDGGGTLPTVTLVPGTYTSSTSSTGTTPGTLPTFSPSPSGSTPTGSSSGSEPLSGAPNRMSSISLGTVTGLSVVVGFVLFGVVAL